MKRLLFRVEVTAVSIFIAASFASMAWGEISTLRGLF